MRKTMDEQVTKHGVLCSQDVQRLVSKLTSKTELIRVPFPKFNHIDFMWAKDVYNLVYESVIKSLKKHESKTNLDETEEHIKQKTTM
jgi:hypothetical protein